VRDCFVSVYWTDDVLAVETVKACEPQEHIASFVALEYWDTSPKRKPYGTLSEDF